MNSGAILAATFPVLLILGVLLAPLFVRRAERSRQDADRDTSTEEDRRSRHAVILDVQPPSTAGGDRYFAKWSALQAKFEEPPAGESPLLPAGPRGL